MMKLHLNLVPQIEVKMHNNCDSTIIECELNAIVLFFFLNLFKGSSSINGSTLGSVKSSCCHRCGTAPRSPGASGAPGAADQDTNSTINGSEPVYQGIVERDISVIRKVIY